MPQSMYILDFNLNIKSMLQTKNNANWTLHIVQATHIASSTAQDESTCFRTSKASQNCWGYFACWCALTLFKVLLVSCSPTWGGGGGKARSAHPQLQYHPKSSPTLLQLFQAGWELALSSQSSIMWTINFVTPSWYTCGVIRLNIFTRFGGGVWVGCDPASQGATTKQYASYLLTLD